MQISNSSMGYYLIVTASIIIILAGLKSASAIVVPFLLSIFIAIILAPFYSFLHRKKIPDSISITLLLITLIAIVLLTGALIGTSLQSFNSNIPIYESKLNSYVTHLSNLLDGYGINLPTNDLISLLQPNTVFKYAATTLKSMGSFLTNSFVILLSVVFILLESAQFEEKFSRDSHRGHIKKLHNIAEKIKHYIALKSIISLVTGAIIYLVLLVIGLDYAILWGVLAFLLNFIPNIGSIIAAVPAVLLALVQFGPAMAGVVATLFIVVNTLIGSVIEPKVMGNGLGLSTLIVFLSLIFWGWLLGPVGMLLSIPLTIMVKIILQEQQESLWIATLLGNGH